MPKELGPLLQVDERSGWSRQPWMCDRRCSKAGAFRVDLLRTVSFARDRSTLAAAPADIIDYLVLSSQSRDDWSHGRWTIGGQCQLAQNQMRHPTGMESYTDPGQRSRRHQPERDLVTCPHRAWVRETFRRLMLEQIRAPGLAGSEPAREMRTFNFLANLPSVTVVHLGILLEFGGPRCPALGSVISSGARASDSIHHDLGAVTPHTAFRGIVLRALLFPTLDYLVRKVCTMDQNHAIM